MNQVGLGRGLFQLITSLVDGAPRMAERSKCLEHTHALDVVDDDPVQPAQLVTVALERLDGGSSKGHQEEQD